MGNRIRRGANDALEFIKTITLVGLLMEGYNKFDRTTNHDSSLQTRSQIEKIVDQSPKKEAQDDYALLINAQGRGEGKSLLSTETIEQAYQTLKNRGFNEENIIILTPTIPSGRNMNKGITAKPSKENLELATKYLAKNLGTNSVLTITYEGHQRKISGGGKLLVGNSKMSSQEFSDYFSQLPGKKIFLLDTCYAGHLGKKINTTPGDKLVLCATDENHTSSVGFGKDVWTRVDQGIPIRDAYKGAIESYNKGFRAKLVRAGGVKNIYTEYSHGNVELPYPAHKLESQTESKVPFLKGLEDKLINSLLIISIFTFILSLSSTITGNAIGLNAQGYLKNKYLLFSSALMCVFLLSRKILKK